MSVTFLCSDLRGCGFYRCYMPAVGMNRAGADAYFSHRLDEVGEKFTDYEPFYSEELAWKAKSKGVIDTKNDEFERIFDGIDTVVYQYPADETVIKHQQLMQSFGKRTFVEYDDWNFGLKGHPFKPTRDFWHNPKIRAMAETMCREATGLIVTTEHLGEKMSQFNDNIMVLPNSIDETMWSAGTSDVSIGYAASEGHKRDLRYIGLALWRISKKWPVRFMGCPPEGVTGAEFIGSSTLKGYPEFLKGAFSIGIAPLIRDEFSISKSPIKWFEYSLAGIATVAENYPPYSDVITHGETGYLCDGNWEEILTYLAENPEEVARIVENARKEVLEKYTLDKNTDRWINELVGQAVST
jgi:hypothetical protein